MNQEKQPKQFVGRNMFYDKANRLIYMDPSSQTLYVITNSEVRALYILNNRFAIAVLVALVLYFYLTNTVQIIAISVVCYGLLSLAYRKLFLSRLEVATGITKDDIHIPNNDDQPEEKMNVQTLGKTLLTAILAIAVSVLFYLNVRQTPDMSQMTRILHYVLAIATLGYGVIQLLFLLHMKKVK